MHVQAGVVQNLDNARTQINALVSSSQSASGALQAAQSGNQLIGARSPRNSPIVTAVMAAIARAQSLDGVRKVEDQAQAQQQVTNFLNYGVRLSTRLRADVPLMRGQSPQPAGDRPRRSASHWSPS